MENTTAATDVRLQIERANKQFMDTYQQGDSRGMALLYTYSGMVLPPNGELVEGREQIQNFWQGVMDKGIKSIQLQVKEVEQLGDTAYEVSRATLSAENGQVMDQAKYIVIWKKEGGEWKLHRDIFNSSLPPIV